MFFFFNDPATSEIYTLSLHDALPISRGVRQRRRGTCARLRRHVLRVDGASELRPRARDSRQDRKSTRLNSSHSQISYAVFCLKKKSPTRKTFSRRHSASTTLCALYCT